VINNATLEESYVVMNTVRSKGIAAYGWGLISKKVAE